MNENAFVFLYPIQEYFNREMAEAAVREDRAALRKKYKLLLNRCIDIRYRQKGFTVNYVVFDGHEISDIILLQKTDRIISAGMDFKTHTTLGKDNNFPYSDANYMLNQLGNIKLIRIAGFHMWDCVDKFAKAAYDRGLDTLVDEDLTDFFTFLIQQPSFRCDVSPNFGPPEGLRDDFMNARKSRPGLWQKY